MSNFQRNEHNTFWKWHDSNFCDFILHFACFVYNFVKCERFTRVRSQQVRDTATRTCVRVFLNHACACIFNSKKDSNAHFKEANAIASSMNWMKITFIILVQVTNDEIMSVLAQKQISLTIAPAVTRLCLFADPWYQKARIEVMAVTHFINWRVITGEYLI